MGDKVKSSYQELSWKRLLEAASSAQTPAKPVVHNYVTYGLMDLPWKAIEPNVTKYQDVAFVNFMKTLSEVPWGKGSDYTAVFLEFRPIRHRVAYALTNAMDNLPVYWRVQVMGGPSVLNLVRGTHNGAWCCGWDVVAADMGKLVL